MEKIKELTQEDIDAIVKVIDNLGASGFTIVYGKVGERIYISGGGKDYKNKTAFLGIASNITDMLNLRAESLLN